MSDSKMIPQINEIKPRRGVELTIKSCFPENTTLEEQAAKVDEEMNEVAREDDEVLIAQEALDVAVAAVGLAEIALREQTEEIVGKNSLQGVLQGLIDDKYDKKQLDFSKEG